MQGRLQGKRLHAQYFLDEVLDARHRGVQLPARRRRRHEHRRRLRDVVVGARLRRLRASSPDLDHAAAHRRGSPAPRWCQRDLHLAATAATPVASRRGQILKRQVDRGRRGAATPPSPAPSSSSSSSRTPTRRPGTRGYRGLTPANQYNVDYSMLGTARVEPLLRGIRNEMAGAGHDRRVGQGRVQPRPARDRLPLRRASLRTCDNHVGLQDRRQGDRRPGGQVAHLHGQVRRARGQLLPHPPVACAAPTATMVFADDDRDGGAQSGCSSQFIAGHARPRCAS